MPYTTNKSREIGSKVIQKVYQGPLGCQRTHGLQTICQMVQDNRISYTDYLVAFNESSVILDPKCIAMRRRTSSTHFQALVARHRSESCRNISTIILTSPMLRHPFRISAGRTSSVERTTFLNDFLSTGTMRPCAAMTLPLPTVSTRRRTTRLTMAAR
ncbi:hypothetical protein BKA93DRAFT_795900 [Sparassis latifolia]